MVVDVSRVSDRFVRVMKSDPRIDSKRIRQSAGGSLPRAPEKQNALWYRIYKKHEDKPSVRDSQRLFLLNRDLATFTLLAILVLAATTWFFLGRCSSLLGTMGLLLVLYLIFCVVGQTAAHRFVLSVLAEESGTDEGEKVKKVEIKVL